MTVTTDARDPRDLAARLWPRWDWSAADLRQGAFHDVLIVRTGPVARIARGSDAEARTLREQSTLRTLTRAGIPLSIPETLESGPRTVSQGAVLMTRLVGEPADNPHDLSERRLADYRSLLQTLRSVPIAELSTLLPPPRAWCGGTAWPDLVETNLLPLLPRHVRTVAMQRVDALLASGSDETVLCHGDFGPHNILWSGGRPTGLIDLDHACVTDPAVDIAPLIGSHGAAAVSSLGSPDQLRRAMVHRATLPLQVAAAAHLAALDGLRDHALGNLVSRVADGTLFDPGGLAPEDIRGSERER